MQDITPTLKSGKKVIESYGGGGFKISGTKYDFNVIVLPDSLYKFEVADIENAQNHTLSPIIENAEEIEVLLVGCGDSVKFFPEEIEKMLKEKRINVEYMNTGAAARTYNVLLTEERKVAVVLIAV
jgi:uncharacterized protein